MGGDGARHPRRGTNRQALRLSEFFLGLTVLAIGSDLPELAVAIAADFRTVSGYDPSGIVIGSSIVSACAQIGFVLSVAGLIGEPKVAVRHFVLHDGVLVGSACF